MMNFHKMQNAPVKFTAIKQGGKLLPIYVEKNDPHKFVMAGRHRMVAFWLLKINMIPVAYVTKKI